MSDSSWSHGLQHSRLPCPSLSPGVCPSSCPLNQWCHPTISSSVIPFFSCLQAFPSSESFPMSQLFVSGGQSIGALASVSVLPMNIQDWFPLGLTCLTSLLPNGLSRISSPAQQFESINYLVLSLLHGPTLTSIPDYWKDHSLNCTDLCQQSDVWLYTIITFIHLLGLLLESDTTEAT